MSILTRRLSNIARRLSSTDPNTNSNSELSPSNKKTAQEEAQNSCNDFLKLIERFDSLIQEPNSYISSELDELKLRVERKRDELKLIIDKEANKLTSWLDEFKDELIDEVNTDKLKSENSAAIEEARLKQEELAEKLDGSKKLSDSGAKDLAKSCEEWSTKLTGSIDAVKGQLMTRKYAEKCEVVNRFAKVNISANLCFWKIHSQIIHINYQSDFFKSCGFQVGQNWDLLYRSSGSEYSGHELLSQCTGKSPLLVIVRTHNGIITGGYTESRWDQRAKKASDSRALVFRKSPHEKQFELFRRDGSSPYEVYCDPNSGPCFYGAYGLKITNDSAVFLFRSSVNESDRFVIDSIECFRKVKKRVDFYEKDVNGAAENVPKSTYKDIRANLKNWG